MIALLVSLISAMPSPADEDLMAIVKTKAVPAWKRMARLDFSGKGRIEHFAPMQTSGINLVQFEIGRGLVSAQGTRKGAWLWFSVTTPADRHLAPLDENRKSTAEPLSYWAEDNLFGTLSAPYCIYGIPLFYLLDEANFEMTSAERVVHNGSPRVRLNFRQTGEQSKEARRFYAEGWCLLDESADWAIAEYQIRNRAYKHPDGTVFDARMHRVIEYAPPIDGNPIVKSVRSIRDDGKVSESYDLEFTPMPADQIRHRTGLLHHPAFWPVVALAVVAAAFVYWKRRKKRRSAGLGE